MKKLSVILLLISVFTPVSFLKGQIFNDAAVYNYEVKAEEFATN